MKSLKIASIVFIVASIALVFTSCRKEKEDVKQISKEQLVGKWNMTLQASNAPVIWHAELKAGGAMEIDQPPFDGKAEIILLWDLAGNHFTAHLDYNGVANYWQFDAPVDLNTLSMAGKLKVNDPNSPQTAVFTMDKQ